MSDKSKPLSATSGETEDATKLRGVAVQSEGARPTRKRNPKGTSSLLAWMVANRTAERDALQAECDSLRGELAKAVASHTSLANFAEPMSDLDRLCIQIESERAQKESAQREIAASQERERVLREASVGVALIAAERQRQISVEGWTPEHDDNEHPYGDLTQAALNYAEQAVCQMQGSDYVRPRCWPWNFAWWKPSPDPIRNLMKAGALIAAEIDRLTRAASVLATPRTTPPCTAWGDSTGLPQRGRCARE